MSDSPGGRENAGGGGRSNEDQGESDSPWRRGCIPKTDKGLEIWAQLMQTAPFQSKTVERNGYMIKLGGKTSLMVNLIISLMRL